MGLSPSAIKLPVDARFIAERGGFCEQFVAENLKCAMPEHLPHRLYHWERMRTGSDAEVDFLIAVGSSVVPLEVKAGKTDSLKSLHQYLIKKGRSFGVRINGDISAWQPTSSHHEIDMLLLICFYSSATKNMRHANVARGAGRQRWPPEDDERAICMTPQFFFTPPLTHPHDLWYHTHRL